MLMVIIGASGVGKSTTARRIASTSSPAPVVLSAGYWIRSATGRFDHSPETAAFLAEESRRRLEVNPLAACETLTECIQPFREKGVILEGIRNPTDLLHLLRPGDAVLDIGGAGTNEWERTGLAACRNLQPWAEQMGVTWTVLPRFFAPLPAPLPVYLSRRWLYGGPNCPDPSYSGAERGHIIALECYPRQPVTCTFRAECGGIFHDLPLETFCLPLEAFCRHICTDPESEGAYRLPSGGHSYTASPSSPPVLELFYGSDPSCWVYDRDKDRLGRGEVLYVLHWPDSNELLCLVDLGGRLLLWPPHKLLFTEDPAAQLPDWCKLRVGMPSL